ncbi:DUF155-domain-containing protein [Ascobolus immersus RN42]|uniref:DUF155-domain-containing protein n=1 Tax=Ascobolus immersus RN42 TaxID=1160509 RepID=A0A3N4IQM5_ASCIM|nr:DUF155-domain-containing protein [Ascobolus immersus RN42]
MSLNDERTGYFDGPTSPTSPQDSAPSESQPLLPPRQRRASDSSPGTFPNAVSTARQKHRRIAPTGIASLPKASAGIKVGPQRASRKLEKLKILPSPAEEEEESGRDVYSQVTRIKDQTARRDAERLGKAEKATLPRVTAYCTAKEYNLDQLMRYLKGKASVRGSNPKRIDECIYSPFSYSFEDQNRTTDLLNLATPTIPEDPLEDDENADAASVISFVKQQVPVASEVFLFSYGVVVIWGMTEKDENRFLKDLEKFEKDKLPEDSVQVENFNYYITDSYQPRIYNDFITLKDGKNYMYKLSISHAIAQSAKISLLEDYLDATIEEMKSIPREVATTGKIKMSRKTAMMHIGELFILRIEINLQGNVLDSPELMWDEPHLDPLYKATRAYLEINQRVAILNQRLDVIGDLLQMLKEQMSHSHGEYLEWIVIILIAAEILVALINVVVDLAAASD